jgi:hypothetical protein
MVGSDWEIATEQAALSIKTAEFDTTPGGTALTHSISERFDEILEMATRIATEWSNCDEDSCCYSCLRNLSNQRRHDHLFRSLARETIVTL